MSDLFASLNIKSEGIILQKTDLPFEQSAVLNPSCVTKDGLMYMFYRAVASDGISSIGLSKFKDGKLYERNKTPILFPEKSYEIKGLEDPRIVFLEGTYYLFYTVYDGKNAQIAYATSNDLITFTKRNIISPQIKYSDAVEKFKKQNLHEGYINYGNFFHSILGEDVIIWDKDAFIFPKKINNKIAFVHRIMPGIQIQYVDSLEELESESYWSKVLSNLKQYVLIDPVMEFENRKIGGGCPPIETPFGWLFIYHTVEYVLDDRIYHASAALLDLNDPQKVIGRLAIPLFSPNEIWELKGAVDHVVFPTGTFLDGDRLIIYYGAADKVIAAKSLSLQALLQILNKK